MLCVLCVLCVAGATYDVFWIWVVAHHVFLCCAMCVLFVFVYIVGRRCVFCMFWGVFGSGIVGL